MFKHVLVKTSKLTMLVEWGLLGVQWHSDVAICKGPSRNILMPLEVEQVWTSVWHTQRKSPEVPLGGIQTLGLSLVSLVPVWSIHRSRLEYVGGCRWTTLDYRKHHAFAIHSRPKCWKPNRLQWGWPCSLRCTRNVFRMGGTKADQEELQCHHSENPWKPMKTMESHGLPCKWWVFWFDNRCRPCFMMNSEFGVFEHVLVKTTELPCWLNEVCKAHSDHIVTLLNEKELHNTYWSNWKSTSLNICLKIVCKTIAKKESWSEPWELSKPLHDHWCYWYRFAKPADKQLHAS